MDFASNLDQVEKELQANMSAAKGSLAFDQEARVRHGRPERGHQVFGPLRRSFWRFEPTIDGAHTSLVIQAPSVSNAFADTISLNNS